VATVLSLCPPGTSARRVEELLHRRQAPSVQLGLHGAPAGGGMIAAMAQHLARNLCEGDRLAADFAALLGIADGRTSAGYRTLSHERRRFRAV
jgi:hypothetical protein